MEKRQTQVLTRARPVRLAFFVELEEASHPKVDAIFEYAFSIWGGRFSLIVPCLSGEPLPEYLPWLAAFDPDLIYSYVDLAPEKQQRIHETYFPSVLQHHPTPQDGDHRPWVPSLSISPLEVQTLLPLAGLRRTVEGIRGVQIVGAMGRMEKDRFLADSFGVARPNLRNIMSTTLADLGSMILAVSEDEYQPRNHYIRGSETTTPNTIGILEAMTESKQVLGVAHLSALSAPRLSLDSRRWSGSFNIVVGDTVEDRLLYWNAHALMPTWRDGDDVGLCIPSANFKEPGFIEAIRNYLNRRNFVNGISGGGPNRATLRSLSLPAGELGELALQLQQGQSWIAYSHECVSSLKDLAPDASVLEHSSFAEGSQGFHSPKRWVETYSIGDELRLVSPEIEHLRYLPPAIANSPLGAWAIDLDIQRAVDHSPYSNVSHRWRLPRRLRVTQAFCPTYQLSSPIGEFVWPRASSGGLLTLFANSKTSLPLVNVPSDYQAIVTALQRGRDWGPFDRANYGVRLPQPCFCTGPG